MIRLYDGMMKYQYFKTRIVKQSLTKFISHEKNIDIVAS
jgi:hypothetical protein